jgi:hypothetical protein
MRYRLMKREERYRCNPSQRLPSEIPGPQMLNRTNSSTSTCEATCEQYTLEDPNETPQEKAVVPSLISKIPARYRNSRIYVVLLQAEMVAQILKVRLKNLGQQDMMRCRARLSSSYREAVRITWPSVNSPREHSALFLSSNN